MPESHFLRNLEQCVDFSFIYDIVEPLYAKVGRPSIAPVLLVKMLLLGYLYGIPSERKLEQEALQAGLLDEASHIQESQNDY